VVIAPQRRTDDQYRDNATLRREMATLRLQLAEANARNAELIAEVGRLATLVALGNERISELLAIAQRKKRNPKKDKPDKPPEPPASVDEQTRKAFEDRPAPPKLPDKDKPAPKPRRPTGRQAVPEHLEAERHTVTPKQCACCGSDDLKIVDEVVETKLHVVKQHQRRRVVVPQDGTVRQLWRADHRPIVARAVSALEGDLRVARLAGSSEVRHARAAGPHSQGPRIARDQRRDELSGHADRAGR
jgi:hypothetical protein